MYILKALCDSAKPEQYGYQDPVTPSITKVIDLQNDIIFYLIIILCLVCMLLFCVLSKFRAEKNNYSLEVFIHCSSLERVEKLKCLQTQIKSIFKKTPGSCIKTSDLVSLFNLTEQKVNIRKAMLKKLLQFQEEHQVFTLEEEKKLYDFLYKDAKKSTFPVDKKISNTDTKSIKII